MSDEKVTEIDSFRRFEGGYLPNVGVAHYSPGGKHGLRVQLDYQLVLVHTGDVEISIDGIARQVEAGHVAMLYPGHHELFLFSRRQATQHSWIAIPPRLVPKELERQLEHVPATLPLSSALTQCVEVGRLIRATMLHSDIAVLAAVAQASLTIYAAEGSQDDTVNPPMHPLVRQGYDLIIRRASAGITVQTIAHELGVSPEHLIRLFRRDLHKTPGELLHTTRLEQALYILAHTGVAIADVAHQTGFSSSKHFARSVRALTGVSPTVYRKTKGESMRAATSQGKESAGA